MFAGDCAYKFETEDKISKYISTVGKNCVPQAVAYGERNIYYKTEKVQFI